MNSSNINTIKCKLLVIAISVMSLSCATTINNSPDNTSNTSPLKNKDNSSADSITKLLNQPQLSASASKNNLLKLNNTIGIEKPLTLEKIMSDPDWIGRAPESWYWGDDNQSVFYKQKREGNILRDLFVKNMSEKGNGKLVNLANLHQVSDQEARFNQNRTHKVYTFEGNIFLKNLLNQNVQQLTHTSAIEMSPQFLTNGDIAYRVANVFYSINLKNNQIKELANLQMTLENEQVSNSSDSRYLQNEQLNLIKYIKLQQTNNQLEKDQKREWRVNNKSITQSNFYFNKHLKVIHASLSPAGNKIIVSVASTEPMAKSSDVMPNYVTGSGNIAIEPVRSRVADNLQYQEFIYLLDITDGTKQHITYESLPGFNDDVLAKVKTENYALKGKSYKSKKSPRYIHIMEAINPIQWNKKGDQVALLLEAWDNKDRWLTTVDFQSKKFESQHRLHDNAWINWSFNEFGWLNTAANTSKSSDHKSSDRLYYLSEESGFSHLYVKPLNANAKQLTSGKFEVNDLTLSNNEETIFYRANQKHPGIYEIYQIELNTGNITRLTDLGGDNYFQLSPDNSKLLISHSTINMPPELYVEVVDNTPEATRLTHTVSEEFLNMPWSLPKVIAIPSTNQAAPIYSKVYFPKDFANKKSKNKAVMFSHGAGYLQNSHLGWSGYFREHMFHSLLVQKGYVVIDMDYRASAGYGRDWRTAIYRHMGKPEVEDMRNGVNWLVQHANVDANRVGTYGGSYGGFLTLMSMFTQPDLFQSGAALRLVSDWAYYNHGYTANILNTPADDPMAYERSSPIYFVEGLQKTLLINAPMIDDNVFFQDTVRLVQRLIELEKQNFETAIYPVEPHGFVQPSSWLDEYRRIFNLFETTLN